MANAENQIRSTVEVTLGSMFLIKTISALGVFSALISTIWVRVVLVIILSGSRYVNRFGPSAIMGGSKYIQSGSQSFLLPKSPSPVGGFTAHEPTSRTRESPVLVLAQQLTGCWTEISL